jgi:hypothetical protein
MRSFRFWYCLQLLKLFKAPKGCGGFFDKPFSQEHFASIPDWQTRMLLFIGLRVFAKFPLEMI